ncbi:MAG: hypothetical protein AB7I30_13210 [Isosphaeraceae bacterium]
MSIPNPHPELSVEPDARFPSGKWIGFFLQPLLPGKHPTELILTFRQGVLKGEGRDWVGKFVVSGRYQVEDGRCWWSKHYLGKHTIAYKGYNEGKGIWGTWSFEGSSFWKGGFLIWPEGMADPTRPRISEAIDEPVEYEDELATEIDAVFVPVRRAHSTERERPRGPRGSES